MTYMGKDSKRADVYIWQFTLLNTWNTTLKVNHTPINIKKPASVMAQMIKNPCTMQETRVWSLGWEDPLEESMATHSSILAWRIPQTEGPGGLLSTGSQRVGHDWATKRTHTQITNMSYTLYVVNTRMRRTQSYTGSTLLSLHVGRLTCAEVLCPGGVRTGRTGTAEDDGAKGPPFRQCSLPSKGAKVMCKFN